MNFYSQTITQDAFCAFFISQRSLVHLMEVVFRVNDTVDLYLQDLKVKLIMILSYLFYLIINNIIYLAI